MSSRAVLVLQVAVLGALIGFAVVLALIVVSDEAPARHAAELPDYLQPHRPLGIRVINAVGIFLSKVGLLDVVMSLDADHLLSTACGTLMKGPGPTTTPPTSYPKSLHCVLLDDDEEWHPSFRRLTRALEEAELTFLGRVVARGQVLAMLETRGRLLEAFAKEDPSAAAASSSSSNGSKSSPPLLLDPIFVVGLPRTGTTFLQRLLAVDPANRSPTLWEYMDPVPRPPPPPPPLNATREEIESYRADTHQRISQQQWKLDQYKSLAPGLDAMHPLNATHPEECLIVMNYAMDSEQIADTYPVHAYLEYLLTFDNHRHVLRWNKRILQHLQRVDDDDDPFGPRRWVVKTPYYLAMLDDIRAVHPNAKIIHLHRDPEQSIRSVSSLLAKLHGIVSDDIDLRRIGAQQFEVREKMVDMAMKVRKEWADKDTANNATDADANVDSSFRIVDVHLQDLQRDPVRTVGRIYEALFDGGLSPDTAALMSHWLLDNPRTKHGTHRLPTMAEFGLEGRMGESEVFRSYREMFGAKSAASLSQQQQEQGEEIMAAEDADSMQSEL